MTTGEPDPRPPRAPGAASGGGPAHRLGPFVVPAFGLAFCALFLYESRGLAFREAGYPRVIIGIFLALIVAITVREVLRLRRDARPDPTATEPEAAEPDTAPETTPGTTSWWPTITIAVLLVALVYAMPRAGSVLAIGIFAIVLPPLLGYRRHLVTIAACAITAAITYFIFINTFGVPLP
jgi:Tripartite tricarboxylate transporter TctB family